MRRWVASYYAPNFLNPPLELMGLGAIAKQRAGASVRLIDAIAEDWDEARVIRELQTFEPDLLVVMPGFNTFPRDMACLERIMSCIEATRVVCFGYLPTHFAKRILENTRVDVVLRDEPEAPFAEVYARLCDGGDLRGIAGIAYTTAHGIEVTPPRGRLENLDSLPYPDHSLINLDHYNESFLERPIGAIMAERGCPYQCTYCVRTFGMKLYSRSATNILDEIEQLRREHDIRNIRFMDDTFTLNRTRTMELCEGIVQRQLDIAFTCLTRVDSVDAALLAAMKRAGCKRLYVGVESGSQKVLDYYKKGLTLETIRKQMPIIQNSGIEASIFFMVGAPVETDTDVQASIDLAIELDLDYIIVTKLQYWPGTELFSKEGEKVDFDIFSSGELVYSAPGHELATARQRHFYRRFYFRPHYFAKRLKTLLRSPRDTVVGFLKLSAWVFGPRTSDDFI
jgi:radical SAM superfamily enzyme YgiQ (UPF0313 family)